MSGGLTVTARLVPPRDSHCSGSVLSRCLSYPPTSSTGKQQAELRRTWPLRQPAAGSHPTTLELEAVFPAPSKFQHNQKYRSSKGRQVSLRSPLLHRSPSAFPSSPVPQGAGAAQMELPEAHCPQPLHRKEAPGALTGGYLGHHLGTTVKDRTQQDSIPSAVVQSSETLPMPRLPWAQAQTQYRNVKTG